MFSMIGLVKEEECTINLEVYILLKLFFIYIPILVQSVINIYWFITCKTI